MPAENDNAPPDFLLTTHDHMRENPETATIADTMDAIRSCLKTKMPDAAFFLLLRPADGTPGVANMRAAAIERAKEQGATENNAHFSPILLVADLTPADTGDVALMAHTADQVFRQTFARRARIAALAAAEPAGHG